MANNIDNVEFVFSYAPLVWFRTYHKILELLVCYGERKVINPNCKCAGSSSVVMEAYELFQTAVAAYNLNKKEQGEEIIKHIDSLLEGYESADSFIVTINNVTYLFTKDDIIVIDDDSSSDTINDPDGSSSDSPDVSYPDDSSSSSDSGDSTDYDNPNPTS